ncbi:hypothetical protein ACQR1Y_30445 [Bradyrhizobium sp. HKCCYLRH3099]|uniref:hypothetical protein n=1 Tax=unclassified Bradyrhizobium TaxID=2631580 RepID=UPI003EBBA7A1
MNSIVTRWAAAALALVALHAGHGSATEPPRAEPDARIQRAVFADERLWLLSSGGRLSSIAEGGQRTDVATPDRVMTLFVQDGRAAIVTCPWASYAPLVPNGRWTVRRWSDNDWEVVAEIVSRGDALVAAASNIVLTDSRMIDFTDGQQSDTALTLPFSAISQPLFDPSKPLDEQQAQAAFPFPLTYLYQLGSGRAKPLKHWPAEAVLVTPKYVFVGYNAGEFGGGLQRIDRATGVVSDVGRLDSPVNGIATVPWKPDCVAAAIGLIHMFASGQLVEVCHDQVRLLYERQIPEQIVRDTNGRIGSIPQHTTAFFGLQRQGEDLLAVGHDGLYRIGPGDRAHPIPLPEFKKVGGAGVSFDIANVVLVLTTVNEHHSLSGSTPILVPREAAQRASARTSDDVNRSRP